MNSAVDVRRAILDAYSQGVKDLDNNVLKLERRYGDTTYAVAYVDLSDSVVDRANSLKTFQEDLLGQEFFSGESDLRWNSYLYFWAGPNSTNSSGFFRAKAAIERDRHFARKFVVTDDELLERLQGTPRPTESEQPVLTDVGEVWASSLRAASLGLVLEQRPRTATVEAIVDGSAFRAERSSGASVTVPARRDALGDGKLCELNIGVFRKVHAGTHFDFADVNLIIGANGKGKTSLLEAIEALYCGRVRRDPSATFEGIVGKVRMPDGRLETVEATRAVSTAKARNAAWYGRTDNQASAISQGFTRFNFLDTDAAFRLSAEESPEQIKLDLSRLLVGPDTSKLWGHVTNLAKEVSDRLRAVRERLPAERRQIELLIDEIARLKATPSEATVSLQTLKARLAELRPVAAIADVALLADSTRSTLTQIQKELSVAIAASPNPQVSKGDLEQSRRQLQTLSERVQRLAADEGVHLSAADHASRSSDELKKAASSLERWSELLAANVPAQARSAQELQKAVEDLRNALNVALVPSDISPEYRVVSLHEAITVARDKTSQAIEGELAASTALAQQQRLGEKLEALRADLSAVSKACVQQSGDDEHCPVCGTVHGAGELMAKLDSLLASADASTVVALRQSLQFAREEVSKARSDQEALGSIAVLAKSLRIDAQKNVSEVLRFIKASQEKLISQQTAYEAARAHLAQVAASGVNWSNWQVVLDAVTPLMTGQDIEDSVLVAAALRAVRDEAQRLQDKRVEALADLQSVRTEVASLTQGIVAHAGTAREALAALKRAEVSFDQAVTALADVSSQVQVTEDEPLHALLKRVEAAMLAAERALHAKLRDEQASSAMKSKEAELTLATKRIEAGDKARENLERAVAVLSELVEKHSLEQATSDAFRAIRERVSSVFAQIHSPPQYQLGAFDDERGFLVRKDDGARHAIGQVSTGQRAALALSIFLASNESAKSAPPVLLIDDPVAHIDDLNALSFLDYLRELALRANKQVFFATADIRLAALFERKFDFLGSQRFRKLVLQ